MLRDRRNCLRGGPAHLEFRRMWPVMGEPLTRLQPREENECLEPGVSDDSRSSVFRAGGGDVAKHSASEGIGEAGAHVVPAPNLKRGRVSCALALWSVVQAENPLMRGRKDRGYGGLLRSDMAASSAVRTF